MDASAEIIATTRDALRERRQLVVRGDGSKTGWWPTQVGTLLNVDTHRGVVAYDPTELVMTVRAGTPITTVVAALAERNQQLAFEPPQFGGRGTVGGMVSAGMSGPARMWCGATRDAVLGVKLLNGLGEVLDFGGQVMKNVAGYDVSRLVTGAWGALGVILQASLRVQPQTETTTTLCFDLSAEAAVAKSRQLAGQYLPLTGSWWCAGQLFLRLSGAHSAVAQAVTELGGEVCDGSALWRGVRDHEHAFFAAGNAAVAEGAKLWRVIVPPAAPLPQNLALPLAIEWGGALRWVWHTEDATVQQYARAAGGWAWAIGTKQPLDPAQSRLMGRIKDAFDPHNLFATPLSYTPYTAGGVPHAHGL